MEGYDISGDEMFFRMSTDNGSCKTFRPLCIGTRRRDFSIPGVSELFPRVRFQDIFAYLCLRDPTSQSTNPLDKISPIVTCLLQLLYKPKQHLAIGPFQWSVQGEAISTVKALKFGLKAYFLTESKYIDWQSQ